VAVRSDCVAFLTAAGCSAMRDYGVTTVIDLRSSSEVAGALDERFPRTTAGAPRPAGVTYVHRALVDDVTFDRMRGAKDMLERYLLMLEYRRRGFREVFESLAQADGPVLFHCMAGKDRTGLIAALLLELAGVSRDAIAADFAETDRQLASWYDRWLGSAAPEARAAMRDDLSCPPERILAVLDHLRVKWGGVAGYLEAAGMSAAGIDRVSARLA
jgi:protein-tyrosine phosphatase